MSNRTFSNSRRAALALALAWSHPTMALDLDKLWTFSDPAGSAARFEAALAQADATERLVLQTQIARTWGLRRDFERARSLLAGIADDAARAGGQARVRWHLEMGRSWASATHDPKALTPSDRERARAHYMAAHDLAVASGLDGLAVDALHMMPIVDPQPDAQLRWNERALALAATSTQPAARAWEGSLRNNVGYALFLKGDHEAALAQYAQSRAAFERAGHARRVLIADWMIARTWRAQGKLQQALEQQLALERQWDALGEPDPYVFEELGLLYRALGDLPKATAYEARHKAAGG